LRKLLTPWRWLFCAAAALVLLFLLAAGAARFYPIGDLSRLMRTGSASQPLVVMGEVEVFDPAEPLAEPERDLPAPAPEPTLLRDLWRKYIVDLTDGTTRPAPAEKLPPLLPPATDYSFLAMPDTSLASRLLWSASLLNTMRGSWLQEGMFGEHARKASDFQSRKKLIFNEDWLDDAALR